MPSATLSRKQLTVIFQKRTKCLTCDRSNYSVKFSTPHHNACMTHPISCMTHPTPPLYDPLHPCMTHPCTTHPTAAWPTQPHSCRTHPTPAWSTTPHPCMIHHTPPLHDPAQPCMTHPTPAWPTPPHWGPPFGRHVVLWLFHLNNCSKYFCLPKGRLWRTPCKRADSCSKMFWGGVGHEIP